MKLSIIIPHFNSSKLLEKLLSTIPQDKNIQTIVVDDKSKVEHIKYIDLLHDRFDFEFYINDKIKSAGTCRNIGLEKAKGEWVLFADSDDYFVDNFYNTVSKYFKSDNDVVFFIPTSMYLDSKEKADRHKSYKITLKNYILKKSQENNLKLKYNIPVPWSKMVKKSFILSSNVKFDEVLASNDVMFSAKIGLKMKKFEVVDKVIYCVTRSSGSLTTNLKEEIFDIRIKVLISYIVYLKSNLSQEELAILKPKTVGLLIIALQIFGIKKLFAVYKLYKVNNVKWFYFDYFNPILFFSKVLEVLRRMFVINKYSIK
ncbi:MAG: glycosyltransferase family 2 protein [Campylobacterota bacterium]|nr:glycosyltransferase family 2 protein [Campylobacterota bacterium]